MIDTIGGRAVGPAPGMQAARIRSLPRSRIFLPLMILVLPGTASVDSGPANVNSPPESADAPAVVIQHDRTLEVTWKNSNLTVKRRIFVVDRKGFEQADQVIYYRSDLSDLRNFKARTIQEGGRSIPVPTNLQWDSLAFKTEDSELRSLRFTFPAVAVGSVLEWSYTIAYDYPNRLEWWEVQEDIPVLESRFRYRFRNLHNIRLSWGPIARASYSKWCERLPKERTRTTTIQDYVCTDVPAFEHESLSPPEADTRIRLLMRWWPESQGDLHFRYWNIQASDWSKRIESFMKHPESVAKLAESLAKGTCNDAEKVDRIYEYLRNNVTIWSSQQWEEAARERGGSRNAQEVLTRGGASPVEYTLLTMALLEWAGISVDPVLVNDRSKARFWFEMPDFQQPLHFMLGAQVDGRPAYLDPACRYCPAGTPDWRFCGHGHNGVRLTSGGASPIAVGIVPAENNSRQFKDRVRLEKDGSAEVEGVVRFYGHEDVELRRRWMYMTEPGREDDILRVIPGDIERISVIVTDPERLDAAMEAKYVYRRYDMAFSVGERLLIRPPDVFSDVLGIPLQEERRHPLWWPYKRSARMSVDYTLPAGFVPPSLPPKATLDGPGLRFESLWTTGEEPDGLSWTGLLVQDRLAMPVSEYSDARAFVRRLRHVLCDGIVVERKEPGPPEAP